MTTTTPGAVTFTASNWWVPQTVTVRPNAAFSRRTRLLSQVLPGRGPCSTRSPTLYINGNTGTADRTFVVAVKLLNETDKPLTAGVTTIDEQTAIDRLNIRNDSSVSNDVGRMDAVSDAGVAAINVSGLGLASDLTLNTGAGLATFRKGITFKDVEVAKVLLGQGDDTFTVNATLTTNATSGGLTIIEGGGNTATNRGDTITVNGGGGANSPLIVYGDTSQDGMDYSGTSGVASTHGIAFMYSGRDLIDAHNSANGLTIYGGAGNDTIWGSQAGDHIAGGSGNDEIHGQGGDDHIYGDNGINVGEIKGASFRVLSITVTDASSTPNRDTLISGNDIIFGDAGNDIIFGDYGVIGQTAGTLRILTTGNVTKISTARPANGGVDTIYGNDGADRILGGAQGDFIFGGNDSDIILGDHGVIDYVTLDGNNATVDLVYTNNPDDGGGVDTIQGDAGDDLILGGAGGDVIQGNIGNDIVLGDHGRVVYSAGVIAL